MRILFIIYDNESNHNSIPLGSLYIASYIRYHGYSDITFYNQDIYHYPPEHLINYLDTNHFDVIGIGFVAGYHQHKKIIEICDAINQVRHKPLIVLGGQGPSPVPDFYLKKTGANIVVTGEGEIPFLNILKGIDGTGTLSEINGTTTRVVYYDSSEKGKISYRHGIVTNKREIPIKDLTQIPYPAYDLIPIEYYTNAKISSYLIQPTDRMLAVITGRGCMHSCNFCLNLEKGIRLRPMEDVIEEIKKYIKDYNVNYIAFWDELFMLSEKRISEFTEHIMKNNLKIKYWCTGRFDIVNENILKMMKLTGCQIIDYGIEQFDNKALEAMNKKLTEEEIVRGIELTKKYGIKIAFNIIFGNIGDTRESLKKSLDLLHKYNDYGQLRVIRPVTPYPGTALYDYAIKEGYLKDAEDFYNKHVNLELPTVNFTSIPDKEFCSLLFDANKNIIDKYYEHQKEELTESFRKVYFEKDFNFRGARH